MSNRIYRKDPISGMRRVPSWTNTLKGNRIMSLWRQQTYDKDMLRTSDFQPETLIERIKGLFPWYREIQNLKQQRDNLSILCAEKSVKLADNDAQVAELAKACDGLHKVAKERGQKLIAAGLEK